MRNITISLRNSGGSILADYLFSVPEGADESETIRYALRNCINEERWALLPGDTIEFVETD
jgi:hypothetical protein